MSEFVRKDQLYRVPIQGGELTVSPSHDFLHHWARNGAWMLKYWDANNEPPRMVNLVMEEEAARWLMAACGVEMMEREFMGTMEHEHYMRWMESKMGELDFDVDEPTPDGTIEE